MPDNDRDKSRPSVKELSDRAKREINRMDELYLLYGFDEQESKTQKPVKEKRVNDGFEYDVPDEMNESERSVINSSRIRMEEKSGVSSKDNNQKTDYMSLKIHERLEAARKNASKE